MQNVFGVDVPNSESQLAEPVEYLLHWIVFAPLSIFNLFLEITVFGKLSYNTKAMFLINKAFMIFNDIRVV